MTGWKSATRRKRSFPLILGREAEARAALVGARALNDNEAFRCKVQTYINRFQPNPGTEET